MYENWEAMALLGNFFVGAPIPLSGPLVSRGQEQLCEAGEENRVPLSDTEPCPGTIPHGGQPWSDLLEKVPYIQGLAGSPSKLHFIGHSSYLPG